VTSSVDHGKLRVAILAAVVAQIKADVPVLRPDEPIPANPVL